MHAEFSRPFEQVIDPDGPIEQAVLGVNVKMNEVWDGIHSDPSGEGNRLKKAGGTMLR
jgi:hypothetical protein